MGGKVKYLKTHRPPFGSTAIVLSCLPSRSFLHRRRRAINQSGFLLPLIIHLRSILRPKRKMLARSLLVLLGASTALVAATVPTCVTSCKETYNDSSKAELEAEACIEKYASVADYGEQLEQTAACIKVSSVFVAIDDCILSTCSTDDLALYASEAVEAIKTYDSTLIDIISTAVPLPSAAPAAGAKVKRHNGEDHSESASASASASYVSASATAVEEDAVASASASAVELSENAGGRVRAGVAAVGINVGGHGGYGGIVFFHFFLDHHLQKT
ncbi:hypothetical protein BZA05DRAFT_472493 [Tricharina praecox]|uniref:uncharacterized protein n=1 Tax=Tricharina praecox TaxID=43433 RepID=UPI002220CAD8|nr:uncharacterized protein BZA05DRAFT_472493 [Tricharina praecox]KAI5854668.1 hypothetical protein BZA05DRAFT_472493 [Tricharina praecox]